MTGQREHEARERYAVWARAFQERRATLRAEGLGEGEAVHLAQRLAVNDDPAFGTMSIWVEDSARRPIWAAGEKALELGWNGYTPPNVEAKP